MAERDILEFLGNKRISGNQAFFTIQDIEKGLRLQEKGFGYVGKQLRRLYGFGYVEIFNEQTGPFRPFKYWFRASMKGMDTVEKWNREEAKECKKKAVRRVGEKLWKKIA